MKLLPFNDVDLKTPKILEALNEASRSLAELKGFANSIPNQHILINAITINEAKRRKPKLINRLRCLFRHWIFGSVFAAKLMSLAENNPNESHKQGANNICQIVLNFVPLDTGDDRN